MIRFFKSCKRRIEKLITKKKLSAYLNAYYNYPIIANSVLLESRDGSAIDGNIFYILQELLTNQLYADYKLMVSVTNDYVADSIKSKLGHHSSSRISFLKVDSIEYYIGFATAEYLINDATISNFFIKKEGQKYLNVWHGTPLKNMGKYVKHEPHAVGIAQKNFLAADYLLYPSNYMRDLMTDAYNMANIVSATTIMSGYPRNTIFFNDRRKNEIRNMIANELRIPSLDFYKLYMYMPTWRPNIMVDEVVSVLREFDNQLADDEILFVKLHPLASTSINFYDFKHIKKPLDCCEAYEFLNTIDGLITDYSSVVFDFAITRKPIVLFTYDEKEYLETRGLSLNLDDLPFSKTYSVPTTIEMLRKGRSYDDSDFLKKFCPYESKDATSKLCKFFFLGEKCIHEGFISNNGKPNVLVCSNDLGKKKNYESVLNYLNSVNLDAKNYYLLFNKSEIDRNANALLDFPKGAGFIGYTGKMFASKKCAKSIKDYNNGIIDIHDLVMKHPDEFKLEYIRRYSSLNSDEIVFLGNPIIR